MNAHEENLNFFLNRHRKSPNWGWSFILAGWTGFLDFIGVASMNFQKAISRRLVIPWGKNGN